MKKISSILMVVFAFCSSCKSWGQREIYIDSEKAKKLNDNGVETLSHAPCNADSIKKSIYLFKSAISLDSSNFMFYNNLAQVECKLKNYYKAINVINSFFSYSPDSHCYSLILYKGLIFERIGIKDSANFYFDKVMDYYNYEIEKDSSNIEMKLNKISLMFLTKGNNTAISEFKYLLSHYPNSNRVKDMTDYFETFDRATYINETFPECDL